MVNIGIEYEVQVEGVDAVLNRLERATGHNFEAAAQEGLYRWALIMADDMKERAPYRTGKGRRAIYTRSLDGELGAAVVVPPINGVPYMFYQALGTGVYGPRGVPIRPTTAKWLRFSVRTLRVSRTGKARTVSQQVFAREVRGVPPRPFHLDAFHATKQEGKAALAASIARATRGETIGGGA